MAVTGSSMTRHSMPKTSRTQSSVITSPAGRRRRPALAHGDEVVGVARRQVEVVQHHHDRGAAHLVELGEQVEHLDLVGDVEVRRRLVEQQQVGLLGEGHRDPHALALAAGELVDQPVGEVEGVGQLEGLRHGLLVLARPAPEGALVRVPPAADEVDDADALGGHRVLRQQAERARHLARGQRGDRLPVEEHRARRRAQQSRHPPQQRGLAARVGADDHGDLAVRHLGGQLANDGRAAVPQGHAARPR